MDPILRTALSSFSLGREARHKNMSVFPIASLADGDSEPLTSLFGQRYNFFRFKRGSKAISTIYHASRRNISP